MSKPEVVTICGSTRWVDAHAIRAWELEQAGEAICFTINMLPAWYGNSKGLNSPSHYGEQLGVKEILDENHLRKIDLADRVEVVTLHGYYGDSTKREIEYAQSLGKPVSFVPMDDRMP